MPGYISINSGILSYSQSGNSPVNVKIFDLMGNEVFKQSLYGSGQVDLTSGVKAKGTYFAQVTTGSAKQAIRFTANGNYGATLDANGHALLKEVQPGETLRVVADGFDTLSVPLGTLDTTLNLTLTASAPAEETFKFGYALGNAPRKSKGCGKDPVLKGTKQYQCQKKTWDNPWPNANVDCSAQLFEINGREFYVTFPQNYDKNKPYKLLIANHCMGSSANHMATWISADRDHISPYYAQKAQDTEGNYIFVAPQGNDNGTWNGEEDHKFIHQMLTHMEDNYCIDTTRVFATGFSFGAMFSNSLAWEMQERLRAVAVYAVASYNIWLPQPGNGPYSKKDLPIAWMAVHGKQDGMCNYQRARDEALVEILKHNGKADANGNFTDASAEKSQLKEYSNGQHVCYDFTTVDPRFPVKFCSHGADHQWSATDNGDNSKSWVPAEVHKFFEQF
jgi:poly(3-hydroxybutyrate) depolymerase